MKLEGYYNLKVPCNGHDLINTPSNLCLKGSPWVSEYAQRSMGGLFENPNIEVHTDDNFHRVYSVNPVHLPTITNKCTSSIDRDNTDNIPCTLETISVTENVYNSLDQFDSGFISIAATEMRSKLMSRQSVQVNAG